MADRARREKQLKLEKLAELKKTRQGGTRAWKVGRVFLTRPTHSLISF
jgi:hypothetical protein